MITNTQICRFSILKTFAGKFFPITLLAYALCFNTFAQVQDNFSDGNFSTNPTWQGSADRFRVASGQLYLNAPAEAGSAWLATPSAAIAEASWEIRVTMAFNPSANNYTRIYLTADQSDLSGSLNGYFVMIGNTEDEVSLYRQSGTTRRKIIDGADDRTDLSAVNMRIRVTRDATGHWQLYSDAGNTGSYITEGTALDTTHTRSDYFGIYCNYTATRSNQFAFDDVRVTGHPYPDYTAPLLQDLTVVNNTTLTATFSEPVTPESAGKPEAYTASADLNRPQRVTLLSDRKAVQLVFAKPFPLKARLTLTLTGIEDRAGNTLAPVSRDFIYFTPVQALPRDVIINEIMADPTPVVKLPDAEFIEILNRSQEPFDLTGWTLTDGSTTAVMPRHILFPGDYAVITKDAALFKNIPNVFAVTSFPSLNNSGDKLVLRDSADYTIDSVQYADTWYKNTQKKEGGWTLERIDPEDQCRGTENWTAAEADAGGTPGKENSVFASNVDRTGPSLIMAIPVTPDTLLVRFSEKLERTLPQPGGFQLAPNTHTVTATQFADDALTELKLVIQPPLIKNTVYTLAAQKVYDCSGNVIHTENNTARFAVPEAADSLDVIINELLFNPRPNGVDFIEIVNTSAKYINLKNWSVTSLNADATEKGKKIITRQDIILEPGAYRIFTEDGGILKSEYLQAHEETFLNTSLPPMNDDDGHIVLRAANGQRIDQVIYNERQHAALLKDPEGVSLERINPALPSDYVANWRSAASAVGFATPGYLNSASIQSLESDAAITVDPEIFVPIYGSPEYTQIRYRFEQGGYIANARIYDASGNIVKEITRNESLGTEGFLRWDGDRDNGTKARIGQYMIWFEVFNEQGQQKTFRKRVVIADKF